MYLLTLKALVCALKLELSSTERMKGSRTKTQAKETTPLTPSSSSSPARKALFTRWQSFAGVCLFVSVVGTTFAFGIFSALLKTYLDYSQDELDLIASIGNNGLYLSLVAGLLIERLGFQTVVRIGGSLIFIGFLYIWLAVKEYVASDMATISFFYFFSQLGVCFHITSALTVAVKLFPHSAHGATIGLAKGYFALSTAVLGDIAGGIFDSYSTSFLLFIALFIPVVGKLSLHSLSSIYCLFMLGFYGASMANILPPHLLDLDYEHRKGMNTALDPFIIHWVVLFLTLTMVGYCEYAYDLSFAQQVFSAFLVLLVLFSILTIPKLYGETTIPVEECISAVGTSGYSDEAATYALSKAAAPNKKYLFSQYLNPSDSEDDEEEQCRLNNKRSESFAETSSEVDTLLDGHIHVIDTSFYGDSLPLAESIKTWRLWALFTHYLVSTGVGLMVIYNVYAIAEAVDKEPTTFFVTMISLANGLGRVFAGWLSDRSTEYFNVSKLLLLALIVACMSIVQGCMSFGWSSFLFPGLLLVGFLFGCTVSLTAINVADIFGEKYIATNFGLVDSSPIIGSYLYATVLVTLFYENNATVDSTGEETCSGADCFRTAFIINSVSCMVGAMICLCLHLFTPRD